MPVRSTAFALAGCLRRHLVTGRMNYHDPRVEKCQQPQSSLAEKAEGGWKLCRRLASSAKLAVVATTEGT